MATKNKLHQLLQEDQEPFHLHDYIADRRTKLRSTSKNQLAIFHKPKSPVKLLQIPSKTAALLLEAALRIHKTTSSRKHTHRFGTDLSFFGSVLKKLSVKNHKRSLIDTQLQTTSSRSHSNHSEKGLTLSDFRCNEWRSDDVWSEDKQLDTETSCSSSNSGLTRTVGEHTQSPSRCPSPDSSSHPPSPTHRSVKNADEEEKEQCSPVCVLDPPFEEEEHDEDEDAYGLECSYAIVQRKKQQLLHKLSKFEALADLNPKDLEKQILEDELYYDAEFEILDEDDDIASEISSVPADEFLCQVLEKCGFHDLLKIPIDLKKLISDLIAEEEMKDWLLDYTNDVVTTVCDRLNSWKNVEQNTIDMMVGEDLRQDSCKWKANKEELRLVAMDIEQGIFASLVSEVLCEISNPLDC